MGVVMMMMMIMTIMMVMIVTSYSASATLQNLQKHAKTKVTDDGLVLSCLKAKVQIPIFCFNICLSCSAVCLVVGLFSSPGMYQSHPVRRPRANLSSSVTQLSVIFQTLPCICSTSVFVYYVCILARCSCGSAEHCSWRLKSTCVGLQFGPLS